MDALTLTLSLEGEGTSWSAPYQYQVRGKLFGRRGPPPSLGIRVGARGDSPGTPVSYFVHSCWPGQIRGAVAARSSFSNSESSKAR